jgi:hypothetical protein
LDTKGIPKIVDRTLMLAKQKKIFVDYYLSGVQCTYTKFQTFKSSNIFIFFTMVGFKQKKLERLTDSANDKVNM